MAHACLDLPRVRGFGSPECGVSGSGLQETSYLQCGLTLKTRLLTHAIYSVGQKHKTSCTRGAVSQIPDNSWSSKVPNNHLLPQTLYYSINTDAKIEVPKIKYMDL